MAEEKSAPKKEKPAKPAAAPAAEGAPAATPAEKKAKGLKASAEAAAAAAAGGEAAPKAAPAPSDKPVEMIGGVAKQPTAEDLLREELGTIKVRKAKGSKNVTSGYANVLASFNNTIVSITDHKGQVIAVLKPEMTVRLLKPDFRSIRGICPAALDYRLPPANISRCRHIKGLVAHLSLWHYAGTTIRRTTRSERGVKTCLNRNVSTAAQMYLNFPVILQVLKKRSGGYGWWKCHV